jgi:hypothetical protein
VVLAPYDETLDAMSIEQRRRWSRWVLAQLARFGLAVGHTYEVRAGRSLRDFGLVEG